MIKSLLGNSVISLLIKSLGLFFIYLTATVYGTTEKLGLMILYWGYAMYLQGSVILPLTHYSVTTNSEFLINKFSKLGFFIFITAFFLPYKLFPCIMLLSFMTLNSRFDYILIKEARIGLYHSLNGMKNISALVFLLLDVSVDIVFMMYAAGEGLKTLFCWFRFKNLNLNDSEDITLNHIVGFIKYSSYLLLVGSYIVIIKTVIAEYDVKKIVELELILRMSDIILVALTSGVMPIYLNKIASGNTVDKALVEKFSKYGALILSFCILASLSVINIEPLLDELGFSSSFEEVESSIYLISVVSYLMVSLSFKRKDFGLAISFKDLIVVSVIPISLFLLLRPIYDNYSNSLGVIFISLLSFSVCLFLEKSFVNFRLHSIIKFKV